MIGGLKLKLNHAIKYYTVKVKTWKGCIILYIADCIKWIENWWTKSGRGKAGKPEELIQYVTQREREREWRVVNMNANLKKRSQNGK